MPQPHRHRKRSSTPGCRGRRGSPHQRPLGHWARGDGWPQMAMMWLWKQGTSKFHGWWVDHHLSLSNSISYVDLGYYGVPGFVCPGFGCLKHAAVHRCTQIKGGNVQAIWRWHRADCGRWGIGHLGAARWPIPKSPHDSLGNQAGISWNFSCLYMFIMLCLFHPCWNWMELRDARHGGTKKNRWKVLNPSGWVVELEGWGFLSQRHIRHAQADWHLDEGRWTRLVRRSKDSVNICELFMDLS